MESMQRVLKQITNELIDLKKRKGEGKKPFKPFMKKRTYSTPPIPSTSGINIEDYAMDNFYRTHHANHSKRTCPEFINSFTAMVTPLEPPKKSKKGDKEEEEEGEEPPSHLNVLWDEDDFRDEDEDDIMEEACTGNDYNLQSKGALKRDDKPSTSKATKKNAPSKQPSTDKAPKKEKEKETTPEIVKEKEVTTSRTPINFGLTQRVLGDLKLDYDVVEDLKMMKANITGFELCKITQLREQLRDALQSIQAPQDVVNSNSKATPKEKSVKTTKVVKTSAVAITSSLDNKEKTTEEEVRKPNPRVDGALIGKRSRSQTPPFPLTFEIFNRNVHNCLDDSGGSSNVMPYLVCKRLNAQPKMCRTRIIQLDRSHVKVMGELKDVMI
jgi:hypothetical protein